MRVALVQEFVDPTRGGAETSTLEMAQHLAALGTQVTIVCRPPSADKLAAAGELPAGLQIMPIPVAGFTRLGRTYQFLKRAAKCLRRERFDIVHAITPILSADVYQPRGGTYQETVERTLATTRSPTWRELKRLGRYFNLRQRFLARIEQLLLGKYQHHIVVAALSDYVRRQVVEAGFPAARTRVVFNGTSVTPLPEDQRRAVREAQRAKLGLQDSSPVLLFVAHNFRLKGLREAIQAIARQPSPNRTAAATERRSAEGGPAPDTDPRWTLVVVGRDRPHPFARLARTLGVAAQVRFVGTATPIRAWYATADALLHPTWYDPCSRVVLEALAHGLPVITTRYNGAAEVMDAEAGEPGAARYGAVVAEPSDVEALAAGIVRALRPEVGDACRRAASGLRAQLSMSRHAQELTALYRDLRTLRT